MRQPTSKPINPFAEIDRLLGAEKEPMGPEWFTIVGYAKHSGHSTISECYVLLKMF